LAKIEYGESFSGEKLIEQLIEGERRVNEGIDPIPVYEEELIIFGKIGTQ
jgi:hypothetical protein